MSELLQNQVCYTTLKFDQPHTLENYLEIGGYKAWQKIIDEKMTPEDVVEIVKASGLRGRGGAGFPTGLKWSFMPKESAQSYFVVNSDESEPGTCKDRDLIRFNPHALVEGMLIGCYAIRASVGYNYMRGEFMDEPYLRFMQALKEAYDQGYVGKNIKGSGIDIEVIGTLGAGAYICGEETALLESLEGKKGQPRFKPPFPANYGLYGKPTTINNTESVASVPSIIRNGAQWFADMGIEKAGGQKCFSVSGHIAKPGNFEINLGTPFSALLDLAGGMKDNIPLKAVIPGGSSVPVVPGDQMMQINMDYDSIGSAGSMLGSGAVIVMNETTDMVHKIAGRTICALGDAAAMPVQSFVKHYRPEFEYYIEHKRSLVGERLGAVA